MLAADSVYTHSTITRTRWVYEDRRRKHLSLSPSLWPNELSFCFISQLKVEVVQFSCVLFCIILYVLLSLSLHCVLYSYNVLMLCSTVYEPLFQCPYFLFYRICSILTVYFCLIPHCLFFSYSILMFFHSVVSTLSVSLCFVPYCMFYFNIELMFVPQVWSAKYNSAGSKIVSVSDDRAVHIYDCPPVWCHHHCYIINSFIIKLAIC